MSIIKRSLLVIRLSYLVGRAIGHIWASAERPGLWCRECNSVLERDANGRLYIKRGGPRCPVHIAWTEIDKAFPR